MPIPLSRQIQNSIAVTSVPDPVEVRDTWRTGLEADETLNDSDKTFTVTASVEWHILTIWVEFTSTGTAGNRQLVVELQDNAADVIGRFIAGITQAASLTRYYQFGPALADLEAERDADWIMTPFPPTIVLPAAYVLRVYDNNAVDAAADDMIVQILRGTRAV